MTLKRKPKTVSLDTMIEKHIGHIGTPARDAFEQKLKFDLLHHGNKEAKLPNSKLSWQQTVVK